jgi:hypothetical protein
VQNIIFNNKITSIGQGSFANLQAFSGTLTLPNSLTSLGISSFESLGAQYPTPNAINLQLPNSLQTIGNRTFSGITFSNNTLTIPDSVVSIGELAFYSCKNIATLNLGAKCNKIEGNAFEGVSSLGTINIAYTSNIIPYQNQRETG